VLPLRGISSGRGETVTAVELVAIEEDAGAELDHRGPVRAQRGEVLGSEVRTMVRSDPRFR